MKPRFFKAPADFRAWLEKHHADTRELWVGFYKKASGKVGITYNEGVDAALCYGWIDGIKKRVDEVNVLFIATDHHGKFVRNLNQGDFTILACLQQNRPQLSAACNQVLKNHGQ